MLYIICIVEHVLLKVLGRLRFVFRIYFSTNQCFIILNLPFQDKNSIKSWLSFFCLQFIMKIFRIRNLKFIQWNIRVSSVLEHTVHTCCGRATYVCILLLLYFLFLIYNIVTQVWNIRLLFLYKSGSFSLAMHATVSWALLVSLFTFRWTECFAGLGKT